jgi:hypothetical protein
MDACARIVPAKVDVVPRVAELPTCQKMFAARAPPMRTHLTAGRGRKRTPDLEDEEAGPAEG